MMFTCPRILLLILSLCSLAAGQEGQDYGDSAAKAPRVRTEAWPTEALQAAGLIPIQDGGRNKPLGSMAGFMMLSVNGKQSFTTEWGEKLDPMAWFLDCIFFPEQAMAYRSIQVVDYRIIESIGLQRRTNKRADRYSLAEILPASERLQAQARAFSQKQATERTALEGQVLNLAYNVRRLLFLTSYVDFARAEFDLAEMPEIADSFPESSYINSLDLISVLNQVRERSVNAGIEPSAAYAAALDVAQTHLDAAHFLRLIPPSSMAQEIYYSPADVIQFSVNEPVALKQEMAVVNSIPSLVEDRADMSKLSAGLIALQSQLQGLAEERGDFAKIQQEVTYYERDWFYRAQMVFLVAFLFCLFSWFFKKQSLMRRLSYGGGLLFVLAGEALVIGGIVSRCLLKERPPVTTVYEAILFIFAAIVLLSLFIELIKRNSLALSLAALVGAAGMYVGNWNLKEEAADTISPLVAVLNTNFWLSIHVPTITLGYAAGILAAVFGHVFLLGKVWDLILRSGGKVGVSKGFFGDLTKMTYGVLCFGALTATVGTILGGVWANDSWGRFWGWDPKENGALLLCLGYLVILHGRMGGYLRQFGIALASIALGNVVLFAFWGVNLLQIGFHSYGFDATKDRITTLYYWTEWSVVAFGLGLFFLDRLIPKVRAAK